MPITELGHIGTLKCLMEKKIEAFQRHSQDIWALYL